MHFVADILAAYYSHNNIIIIHTTTFIMNVAVTQQAIIICLIVVIREGNLTSFMSTYSYALINVLAKMHFEAMTIKTMAAIVKFVLMLMLGYQIAPSTGFIPTKVLEIASKVLSFSLEDAITHEEMTRSALLEVAAEVLWDNPNPSDHQGSSQRLSTLSDFDEENLITAYYGYHDHTRIDAFESAIEAIEEANSNTDFGEEEKIAAAHFDSEQFESGQNRLINLRHSIISSITVGDVNKAREDTGRFLHALQDFYSHTNWIENGNRVPNPVLGQPNKRKTMLPVQHSKPVVTVKRRDGLLSITDAEIILIKV